MIKVKFINGLKLQGETYDEVVRKLRGSSFNPADSIDQFMQDVSRYAKPQTCEPIFFNDCEAFINASAGRNYYKARTLTGYPSGCFF